ncbi:MAG: class B sortase, partial [Oscillospiraceae bacterium]|nr:class B sortase [Oscillospiraceae bacterium]
MPEFDRRPVKKSGNGVSRSKNSVRRGKRRKESIAVAILRGLFPWKGDSSGDVIRKFIFLGSLVLITWSAATVIDFYVLRDMRNARGWQELVEIADSYEGDEFLIISLPPKSGVPGAGSQNVEIIGQYLEYYERNSDFVGFVEIYPIVRYPVYQHAWYDENGVWTGDNEFYLHHNHDKIPTENGTIFADYEGKFTSTERPHNTIIYGHNLVTKHLFQPLVNYRSAPGIDPFDYLKQKPIIRFDTLYERGFYKIFAVFQSNVKPHQGEVFDYVNHIYFNSKSHFDNFVADILDRSMYYTNLDIQYGDELLMLSTCDFSMFANG